MNAHDPYATVLDFRKRGALVRTYLWLEPLDYLVTLQIKQFRIGPVAFLVTAFHLDGPWMRKQVNKWYEARVR